MSSIALIFLVFSLFLCLDAQAGSVKVRRSANSELSQSGVNVWNAGTGNYTIPMSYFGPAEASRDQRVEFTKLFNKLKNKPKLRNSRKALERALAFFVKHKNGVSRKCGGTELGKPIANKEWITITDYTIPQDQDRMFMVNIKTGEVISSPAAHGYGSNDPISRCPKEYIMDRKNSNGVPVQKCKIPVSFSNKGGAKKGSWTGDTSRGFYLSGWPGRSSNKYFNGGEPQKSSSSPNYVVMHGLQGGINSRALKREVIFHRASYVNNRSVDECSSSAGCPSINPAVFEKVKNNITGGNAGALMYLHTIEDEAMDQPEC